MKKVDNQKTFLNDPNKFVDNYETIIQHVQYYSKI